MFENPGHILEPAVRQIGGDVPMNTDRRLRITSLPERDLRVRERDRKVRRLPGLVEFRRRGAFEPRDVPGGEVDRRALGSQVEEAQNHGLLAVNGEAGQEERELAGNVALLKLHHVLARRFGPDEEPAHAPADLGKTQLQPFGCDSNDASRIARVFERKRRDLGEVRIRGQGGEQIPAAKGIHHG